MVGMYLFQKFLSKLDDYKFERFWEMKLLPYKRYYFIGAMIYFFVALGIINEILLFGNESLFFAIIIIVLSALLYGVYFIQRLLRFIALNNQRYFQIKAGFQRDSFNKDNVVG